MKLINQVKEHWKKATLYLKRHHKKYIFWILSVSLLVKWISLIVAHTLVHNLSFSFTNDIQQEWNNNQATETVVETETENQENDWTDEEETDTEKWQSEQPNNEEYTETITVEPINNGKDIENDSRNTDEENNLTKWENLETWNWNNWENQNLESNKDQDTENNNTEDDQNELDTHNSSWICDSWDMVILTPIEWDIVWKTFDITWEFTNEDCESNTYTVRLRDSNEQYLDIFLWNYNNTWFSFDSTQLTWKYFSWHKIAVVSDEAEILYRNAEWWEFTIDNQKPEISNIKVGYSTQNNKLNIWDTITISFESDEELTWITVNILWQYALLEEKTWNKYKYSMDFSEKNTLWKIVYWIEYQDKIWNTWYVEWYDNKRLDYTKPVISNLLFTLQSDWKIKITFNTNKKTDTNFIYQISGTNNTKSINNTWLNEFKIILDDIKSTDKYNYSISIEDEAKNSQYIGWIFYISWNEIIFTNNEIKKSELLTDFWFTWEQEKINVITNSFILCANEIDTKSLKIVINKQKNAIINIPKFNDETTNKLTNAFIAVLIERVENKRLPQYAIDEITQDLNNFLIILKLVKDDNNECKQNMTQYYTNRFKKALIEYGLINN